MHQGTEYIAKKPDQHGIIHYDAEENEVWRDLTARQLKVVQGRACAEYIQGLKMLAMDQKQIPQLAAMNKALQQATDWGVEPVPALIPFDKFFSLLAQRKFPAACFIRTRADFDYIQEPDIFHEFFGHCPMLTQPVYADFMQAYGELGKQADHAQQVMLARLYWFTVEFGLIRTAQGLRIYGGGILSSAEETVYALESPVPKRIPLDALTAFRTPYRIDILQPLYFVIEDYQQLYDLLKMDLLTQITNAQKLGMLEPLYEVDV